MNNNLYLFVLPQNTFKTFVCVHSHIQGLRKIDYFLLTFYFVVTPHDILNLNVSSNCTKVFQNHIKPTSIHF